MQHTFVRNYLHVLWCSKESVRVFQKEQSIQLTDYLIEKSVELKCPPLIIGVQPEHIHCLIELPPTIRLSDFVQKAKGSSSHWVNQQAFTQSDFAWQRGYGAFSVSASQLEVVKRYIRKQEEYHRTKPFKEEFAEWKRNYGYYDD
ncbi:MAG: IS200/IS605 family transposase [Prolixibacteraceae bacterium]